MWRCESCVGILKEPFSHASMVAVNCATSHVSCCAPQVIRLFWLSTTLPPKMFGVGCCWLETNDDSNNWVPSILSHNLCLVLMEMKQKKIFLNKNIKMADWDFQNCQFSIFFTKILGIGPWVYRINWCERHEFGSTYMAVRLSEIRGDAFSPNTAHFIGLTLFSAMYKTYLGECNTSITVVGRGLKLHRQQ